MDKPVSTYSGKWGHTFKIPPNVLVHTWPWGAVDVYETVSKPYYIYPYTGIAGYENVLVRRYRCR